ncbi:MAG: hypothetical protein KF905_04220 [Flavobacteriales bacterium]|nr:hypothetical protein [Flavobacteriales bacterium]
MLRTTAIATMGMFMILASGAAIAQAPTWTYAQTLGLSTYSSNGRAVAADPFGNVVITGSFGNGNFEGAQNSTNSQDGSVSKRRADGTVVWSRRFGGGSIDQGLSVACDAQGNVIVGGHGYSAMIDFGWTLPAQGTFGATDAIIAKYDSTGAILWFDVAGGEDHDYTWGVATDAAGNIYAAGHFMSNSITFGNTTLTNAYPLSATGDAFLVKYSPTGQVIWAKRAGGVGGDRVKGLAVTPAGQAYVVGYFESTSFTFGNTSLTHAGGGTTAFLLKFDTNGDPLWARQSMLGPGVMNSLDQFAGVGLDALGNVYVAGNFSASSVSISGTTLTNSGSGFDVMLLKYNSNGALQWARSGGGDGTDEAFSLYTNAAGDCYISGQ